MKKLFLIMMFFLPFSVGAQCVATADDPCVSINQSDLNKATAAAVELKAARDAIGKFLIERAATDAERAAAQVLIKSYDALLATKDKIVMEYEKINVLYKQVIDFQQQIISNLEKQLNKPKTAWAKFLNALKTVATIAFGIAIGRGL